MVRPIVVASVTSSLFFASTACGQVLAAQSDWPPGVQALLERFDSAATSATTLDAAGRAALFTDDATFLNAFGGRTEGRPALDSLLNRLYSGNQFRNAKIERLDRRVRVLAPNLVLVDHLERLTGQGGATGRVNPPRMTHITLLLREVRPGDWRIVYYRAGDNRNLEQERQQRVTQDALENDWANLGRYGDANAKLAPPAPLVLPSGVATDRLSLTLAQGEIHAVIGPNGAGKTTLFNCLSRLYECGSGDILFDGESLLRVPRHRVAAIGIGVASMLLAMASLIFSRRDFK